MPTATAPKPPTILDQEIKEHGRRWIYGIEVFETGSPNWEKYRKTWNEADLEGMVDASEATMEEIEPVVVTNHSKDMDEGKNRGFAGRFYRKGRKLLADLLVDESLYEDMRAARYRRPSVELFENYRDAQGRLWPYVITAVSIQGGKHLEAVRTLEPLHRTLAAQHHFAHGGRALVITFDQEEKTMDPETKALLEKLVAGQEAILAALPKAPMPKEPPGPKMDDASPGAPAPAPSPTPEAPPTPPPPTPDPIPKPTVPPGTPPAGPTPPAPGAPPREPSQVVLKYEQDMAKMRGEIDELKRDKIIAVRAAELERDRSAVKGKLMKFAEGESPRIPPALVDPLADALVLVPENGKRLKFAQVDGTEKEGTPRELVLSVLERIPAVPMKGSGKHVDRPAATPKRLAFEEQVAAKAQAEGKNVGAVWEEELKKLPPDEFNATFGAMVFPDLRDE